MESGFNYWLLKILSHNIKKKGRKRKKSINTAYLTTSLMQTIMLICCACSGTAVCLLIEKLYTNLVREVTPIDHQCRSGRT